jgi:hypothetical protein
MRSPLVKQGKKDERGTGGEDGLEGKQVPALQADTQPEGLPPGPS